MPPKTSTATSLVDRISASLRIPDDAADDRSALLQELHDTATPSLLPRLFGILEDDDVASGFAWEVFYRMEAMDDAYLGALLDSMPSLWERAPHWTQTAVLRVLNTRGEPDDDCTGAFERLALAKSPASIEALRTVLRHFLAEPDELVGDQQQTIEDMLHALQRHLGTPSP